MNISMLKLLEKMDGELHQAIAEASAQQERHVRDRLAAIKALCELAMEQQQTSPPIFEQSMPLVSQSRKVIMSSQVSGAANKQTVISDGANGDSLFDF
jgi:hypothetical protein